MKDIFKGQPLSQEAPQGLRNKVEFEARQPQRASWFNGGFKWATAGTAVAAAAIAGVMFMTPATAKSWDDVADAYQDVRSALIQIHIQEDGAPEQILIAMKGDRFHVSVSGEVDMSMDGREMLIYEAGSETAQLIQFDGIPLPFSMDKLAQEVVSHLSMTNLLKQAEGDIGKDNIEISDVYQKDGRSVYDVRVVDNDGQGRFFVTVDANSDLPLDMRMEELEKGRYVTKAVMSFRFNVEVDDSLLETILPSGVKIEVINLANMMSGAGGDGFDFGGFGDHDHDHDEDVETVENGVVLDQAILHN